MASVPPYLRAFGNSTGQIIKNVFGYLPAPFIYGWFNSIINERAGIKVLMFWGLWAPILLGFGSLYRFRQLKKLNVDKLNRVRAKSLEKVGQNVLENITPSQQNEIISEYLAE